MRIGVISVESGHNYGGILQCYAFQKLLESYGHKVEYIRMVPMCHSKLKSLWIRLMYINFGKILERIVQTKNENINIDTDKLDKVFDQFRFKYLTLSPHLRPDNVGIYTNENYDAIIIGSDQVWTSIYSYSNDEFIGWDPHYNGLRISYSSCSAHAKVRDLFRKRQLKKYLSEFKYISVRDTTTQAFIKDILNKTVEIVPDPSELYEYKEFLGPSPSKHPYIFVYILGSEIKGGHANAIKKIKEQYGWDLKVIVVGGINARLNTHKIADIIYEQLTPEQWVNMLSNATVVYTDSFHAVLFSVKFSVPFLAYYRDISRSSRLVFLKERFNTKNIVSEVAEVSQIEIVEEKLVNKNKLKEVLISNGII